MITNTHGIRGPAGDMTDDHPTACSNRTTGSSNEALVLLSIDVEEYFQIETAWDVVRREDWPNWESRVAGQVDALLGLFEAVGARATFFTLGWVAERHPAVIRRIVQAGHELACHGYGHERLHRMTARQFADDLRRAGGALSDAGGVAVRGYRAPTFSLDRTTAWAVDELAKQGFEYDSSVQPIYRPAYGVADAPVGPHRLAGPEGRTIAELPPLTWSVSRWRLPVAGGGYFRLLPLGLMKRGIAQAQRLDRPAVLYFHPWEFDPDQPRLPLSTIRQLRTRIGLRSAERRLQNLLERVRTMPIGHWLESQDTKRWPAFELTGPASDIERQRVGVAG